MQINIEKFNMKPREQSNITAVICTAIIQQTFLEMPFFDLRFYLVILIN